MAAAGGGVRVKSKLQSAGEKKKQRFFFFRAHWRGAY